MLAVLFASAAVVTAVHAETAAQPTHTEKEYFSAEYADDIDDKEGYLHPTIDDDGGEGGFHFPGQYTLDEDNNVYFVDRYCTTERRPIKVYSGEGKLIKKISSEHFIDKYCEFADVLISGDILYAVTNTGVFCAYDIKTGKTEKYEAGTIDSYSPYALVKGDDGSIVICYLNGYVTSHEHLPCIFRTFRTDTAKFDDNSVKARYYTNASGKRMTEITWFGIKLNMESHEFEIPYGRNTKGEIVVASKTGSWNRYYYVNFTDKGESLSIVELEHGSFSDDMWRVSRLDNGFLVTTPNVDPAILYSTPNPDISEKIITIDAVVWGYEDETHHVNDLLCSVPAFLMSEEESIDEKYVTCRFNYYAYDKVMGPNDFAVTKSGDIYIPDAAGRLESAGLRHYSKDGQYLGTVKCEDIGAKFLPSAMTVSEDSIYMLMYNNDHKSVLCEYDTQSGKATEYPLPEGVNFSGLRFGQKFVTIGRYVVLEPNSVMMQSLFIFDTEKKEYVSPEGTYSRSYDGTTDTLTVQIDDEIYTIPHANFMVYYVLGTDESDNLIISGGAGLCAYSKDGTLLSVASGLKEDCEKQLRFNFHVSNGKMYRAHSSQFFYYIVEYTLNEKFLTEDIYDANLDGKEDTQDAVFVLKYSAGMIKMGGAQFIKSDMNRNMKVNTADAVQILKHCAGM